jgi:hypothetical protein
MTITAVGLDGDDTLRHSDGHFHVGGELPAHALEPLAGFAGSIAEAPAAPARLVCA